MSEVKWIKISTDVFDNRKIRLIESLPEGDALVVIWFKILTLAGNVNDGGYIYITKEIPYTEELLATQFNKPLPIIKLALATFKKFGMIDIVDDVIMVSNWNRYQNIEGMEKIREQTRKRVARHREQRRIEMGINYCAYCGSKATGYDHIIPTSHGGSDNMDNKVPCCVDCNRIKNDKPLVDFLNNNRARVRDDLIAVNTTLRRYVTLSNVTGRYTVTQSNAIDIDIDKDKDKDNKYSSSFSEFWKHYPRKNDKGQAYKCYKARLNDGYSEEELLTACKNYANECEKNKTEQRYIKHASTFLSVNEPFVDYLKGGVADDARVGANARDLEAEERERLEYINSDEFRNNNDVLFV